MGRAIEKTVLGRKGVPWDTNRFMCVCSSMAAIADVLRYITTDPKVRTLELNDRFTKGTNGGWRDCALYITSSDPQYQQSVCEIQIVHQGLLTVREDLKAHDVYG